MSRTTILLALLLAASAASAHVGASADCDGDHIVLAIGFSDSEETVGPDWTEVLLYRRTMGSTDDPVALNADEPFPWTLDDGEATSFEYIDATIQPDQGYGYFLRVIDADGQEHGDTYPLAMGIDWAGCGEFAYARGVMGWRWVTAGDIAITIEEPCDGYDGGVCSCLWFTPTEFFTDWAHLIGEVVEFRGEFWPSGMPVVMECCLWSTDDIVHLESCAGEVATETWNWSSVRSLYD